MGKTPKVLQKAPTFGAEISELVRFTVRRFPAMLWAVEAQKHARGCPMMQKLLYDSLALLLGDHGYRETQGNTGRLSQLPTFPLEVTG